MRASGESVCYVDLTKGKCWREEMPPEAISPYLGGSGFGWALVAKHLLPKVDPFAPENVVTINPGVLVGTRTLGSSKITAITKFPTIASEDEKFYVGSCTGGGRYFGIGLKQAGCDHLVILGQAEKPVTIHVTNAGASIEDASQFWGKGIEETSIELVRRFGDDTGVLAIGTAGENQVRSALAIVDRTNSLGRGGLGAILGSKRVKAIAAHGTGGISVAEPTAFNGLSNELLERAAGWPRREHWIKLGLAAGWSTFKHTQNPGIWRKERWDGLYGEEKRLETLNRVIACASCPLSCRLRWVIPDGEFAGEPGLGSPYSKSATSGQLLNVEDDRKMIHLVTEANSLTGIDYYTTARLIDFVTRMFEQGRLTKSDTSGFELRRDYPTYKELFRMTAAREGFGDVLADGWMRLKKEFGLDPQEYWYAGICKGMDFIYDARPSKFHPLMMTFFTRPRPHHGGTHTRTNSRNKTIEEIREQVEHWGLPKGTVERIFTETPYSGKFNVGRYTRYAEDLMRVKNALGLCTIYTYQALVFADEMARLYNAATGDDLSTGELVLHGERVSNLAKIINVREGFTRADDKPPEVWFRPMDAPEGRLEMRDYYDTKVLTENDVSKILDDYYDERGWNPKTGIPCHEKLQELELHEYAPEQVK